MDKDKVKYIIRYYSHFMTVTESAAMRHLSSTSKLGDGITKDNPKTRLLTERGWLSSEEKVLSLLNDGLESFERNTAARILNEHFNDIYFNNCPACGRLARTPDAKQCRYCYHSWH